MLDFVIIQLQWPASAVNMEICLRAIAWKMEFHNSVL